jgi:cell wall-associated NlpC family hydrolase
MQNFSICTYFKQKWLRRFSVLFSLVFLSACSGPVYKPAGKSAHKSSLLVKAKSLLGKPYRYGGRHPTTGFDCSGFVQYTHATVGVDLPRTTYQQLRATHPISKQQLRPGDLLFFRINRKRFVSHVGIYLGKGKFIHAPSSGKRVSIAQLDSPYWKRVYSSAGRVF